MMYRSRGLTLVSLMVASSIFALLFAFGLKSFHQSSQVWRKVSSQTDVSAQLRRATMLIQQDLLTASSEQISTLPGPTTLTGYDGDAFWFLSALDENGNFVRKSDGSPFWQRNVLYYTVTPDIREVALFGSGGANIDGYEAHCPYKILVRKEIDHAAPTDLTDESTSEELISEADIAFYLTRPSSYQLKGLDSEPGVVSLKFVSKDLVSTRCSLDSGAVNVTLIACANERAKKHAGFGRGELTGQPFLHEVNLTLIPRIGGE
jgi:type II secretory pathway pseudopilin PulG